MPKLEINDIDVGGNSVGKWKPPSITLGDSATSGITIFRAVGGGVQYSFDASSDDEISLNIALKNLGLNYNGSDLRVIAKYQLSANGGGTDDVKLELQHQFITNGDNPDGAGTLQTNTIDVSSQVADNVYTHTFTTNLTDGAVDDDILMMSILRNAQGAGADSYANSFYLLSLHLEIV